MFVGRNSELKSLKSAVAKPGGKATVIVLTGRRRVGKSTLIEHFAEKQKSLSFFKITGTPPKKVNRTKVELSALATQIATTFQAPKPVLHDWNDAIFALKNYLQQGDCLFLIDEVNWFAKTHDDPSGTLFTLWETHLKHVKGLTLIMTGSLAGWIQQNILENTGWYGRISWQHILNPLPLTDTLKFIPAARRQRLSNHEIMSYALVAGGIPFYWERFDFTQSFAHNIQRLAFTSDGYFYSEFPTLMKDLFRSKAERVETILRFLSSQRRSATEIALHLGLDKPNGYLYQTLEMMEKSAFISTTYPWDLKTGKRSDYDPCYYISDPYIRFYFKAIEPQLRQIARGNGRAPANLDSLLGLQFEHVMRNNIDIVFRALRINASDVLDYDRYLGQELEVDLLIETRRSFYLVEMKYFARKVPAKIAKDIRQKLERFGLPRNKSVRSAILHVNGVAESLESNEYIDICECVMDHLE